MLKLFFTVSSLLFYIAAGVSSEAAPILKKSAKQPVVITSETLTADNKNNIAIFEGEVVAKTSDITMFSDKMTVTYEKADNKISKIHAIGNVKVLNKDRTLFSDEAVFFDKEEKIIFSGNPKAIEGENVITGSQIIFFIKDEKAVVERSRVILQNTKELN